MKKTCDCVCHKLGYTYCDCPTHAAFELAAEYRRGYRDGLTDRKQVTAEPRAWEPGDPIE